MRSATPYDHRPVDEKLVSSGVTQVAIGAASGWGLAALVGQPALRERLGVVDVVRLRQAHLDVLIMGGLLTAAGSVPDVPDWARRAAVVGGWTNPLLFVPLAFKKDAFSSTPYVLASAASFTVTCAGWFGIARAARRARRGAAQRA
jgi:hypothetical protein